MIALLSELQWALISHSAPALGPRGLLEIKSIVCSSATVLLCRFPHFGNCLNELFRVATFTTILVFKLLLNIRCIYQSILCKYWSLQTLTFKHLLAQTAKECHLPCEWWTPGEWASQPWPPLPVQFPGCCCYSVTSCQSGVCGNRQAWPECHGLNMESSRPLNPARDKQYVTGTGSA